jgi:hypothetical protein
MEGFGAETWAMASIEVEDREVASTRYVEQSVRKHAVVARIPLSRTPL